MNVNSVEVQRAWGRPIVSSFHAVYSAGGFLGAGIGGLFAYAGATAGVVVGPVLIGGAAQLVGLPRALLIPAVLALFVAAAAAALRVRGRSATPAPASLR